MNSKKWMSFTTLSFLWTVLAGCGVPPADDPRQAPGDSGRASASSGDHDHDHDHDHGHGHSEVGPHGGRLIELGQDEFHAELTHDDETNKVTVYLLDTTIKSPVASTADTLVLNLFSAGKSQQFLLAAEPQPDDAAGQASRYSLTDESARAKVADPQTTGRLTVILADKTFSGKLGR